MYALTISIIFAADCGNLDMLNISNARMRLRLSDTKYQANAAIICDTGYTDKHNPQAMYTSTTMIKCSANGTWANVPKCVRKDCGNLIKLNIPNAHDRREINGTKYNSIANISCDAGYKEKNITQREGITSTLISCNENGTWAIQPTCVRKDCGDLNNININNAVIRRLHNDTKYNATAEIDCDEGYYNKNQTQSAGISTTKISCSEYGKWVNIPMCIRKDCRLLSSPPNGNIAFEQNDTSYGFTATITCRDGYSVVGPDNIVCEKSGNWSSYITRCQINDCGRLPPPKNGNITFVQYMTTFGSNATYTCDDGYYIIGSKTKQCEASGSWSTNETRCQIIDCYTPNPVQDGFIETPDGTKFGAVANISCNPGYTLHGDNFTKCLANGTWNKYSVNCTQNVCPAANGIDHGSVNTTVKSHAVYKCDTGYTLHGQERLFCQLN
ncbi:E-selectin-like, partial [Mercenaria mercenaria]|uniref:E-selectin-like n=1 Tax=Mercenaria mercenaria TaxID=6596 RepID=UPI00234EB32C